MVEADVVDRLDRDVGVGVGGQQDAAGIGLQLDGLRQELDPGHLRHPLVDHEERHGAAAQGQLANRLQRVVARIGRHDPVLVPVARAQVALDGAQHGQIVIDGQDDRLGGHGASSLRCRR